MKQIYSIAFLFMYSMSYGSEDTAKLSSLSIPMTTIKQMEKMNISPMMISRIIKTGVKLKSSMQNRFMYVCNETSVGIVVDDVSGQVVNIVSKICVDDFQKRQDADDKKKRIRS